MRTQILNEVQRIRWSPGSRGPRPVAQNTGMFFVRVNSKEHERGSTKNMNETAKRTMIFTVLLIDIYSETILGFQLVRPTFH